MTDYRRCPKCDRKAEDSMFSSHFVVFKCTKCGEKYCYKCGGSKCPKCTSAGRTEVGKVYA